MALLFLFPPMTFLFPARPFLVNTPLPGTSVISSCFLTGLDFLLAAPVPRPWCQTRSPLPAVLLIFSPVALLPDATIAFFFSLIPAYVPAERSSFGREF